MLMKHKCRAKSIILIITAISIVLCSVAVFNPADFLSRDDAYRFADELKELKGETSNRLIVSSNKQIDYLNEDDIATGIEGLYVLQYPDSISAKNAYDYYNSLSYVKYAVYDTVEDFSPCEVENGSEYKANCVSSVDTNIDDAIKLIDKVKGSSLPVINIGVLDSGIARNNVTNGRLCGGHTYFEGQNEDGTSDSYGHGTNVAGTIINNTLSNVHLYSYQIYVKGVSSEIKLSNIVSAFYLAKEDGCKIISCSFGISSGEINRVLNEVVTDLSENGVIVVAAAGNDSAENVMECPSCCDDSISVGATDANRRLTSYSNFGSIVDIYATGRGLTSIYPNGATYYNFQGTSAAAPVISSICALLLEIKPELKVDDIKELLLETGTATNEDEMSDEHRLIADAYGCIKELTGQELERTELNFEIVGKSITFSSNTENAEVYYCNNSGGSIELVCSEETGMNHYKANLGETITPKYYVINACAYAPGKAKSKNELLKIPVYDYEYGYLINEANETSEYNAISRCEITDEQTMIVPEHINGVEVQEIGNYCYMGNQTVEKIVLPETVKKIDAYAFANCPNLKTVIAPGAEYCGRYAFYDCPNLKNVEMPLVTLANTAMFKNCTSLTCLDIGELTAVCNHAFKNCSIDLNNKAHTYEIAYYQPIYHDNLIAFKCSKCNDEYNESFVEHVNKYYPPLDLNNDGIVNGKDFAYIMRGYPKSYE